MAQHYWKINCMEDKYPGLWYTWFTEQVVAVGWWPPRWKLHKLSKDASWNQARRCLLRIQPDDRIVVQLKNWRIGRIGTVLKLVTQMKNGIQPCHPKRAVSAKWGAESKFDGA